MMRWTILMYRQCTATRLVLVSKLVCLYAWSIRIRSRRLRTWKGDMIHTCLHMNIQSHAQPPPSRRWWHQRCRTLEYIGECLRSSVSAQCDLCPKKCVIPRPMIRTLLRTAWIPIAPSWHIVCLPSSALPNIMQHFPYPILSLPHPSASLHLLPSPGAWYKLPAAASQQQPLSQRLCYLLTLPSCLLLLHSPQAIQHYRNTQLRPLASNNIILRHRSPHLRFSLLVIYEPYLMAGCYVRCSYSLIDTRIGRKVSLFYLLWFEPCATRVSSMILFVLAHQRHMQSYLLVSFITATLELFPCFHVRVLVP